MTRRTTRSRLRSKVTPKPARKAKTASKAVLEETWDAEITSVEHRTGHHPDGRATHCLFVYLRERGGTREVVKKFEPFLDVHVSELRQFFLLFDYPVVDERDLDAACSRVCGCLCRVRVTFSPFFSGPDSVDIVERLNREGESCTSDIPDDIWNHKLHWRLREMDRLKRCSLGDAY